MRNATLLLDAVTVMCPACREIIPEPTTGSEMWTADDLLRSAGAVIKSCPCGLPFRMPAKPKVKVT
jgi:hypothetical protein